jgi:hypothetical protein
LLIFYIGTVANVVCLFFCGVLNMRGLILMMIVAVVMICSGSAQAQCTGGYCAARPVASTVATAGRAIGRVVAAPVRLIGAIRHNAIERRAARRARRCG